MRPPRGGRPLGEISRALLGAAQAGPGTVRDLAQRACVGYDTARFKAKDLVRMGALQPLSDARPQVLSVPVQQEAPAGAPWVMLERSFWEWATDDLAAED